MKRLLVFPSMFVAAVLPAVAESPVAAPQPVSALSGEHSTSEHATSGASTPGSKSIEEYRDLARRAIASDDLDSADLYFQQALARPVSADDKCETLVEYGHFLEDTAKKKTKAASVYEQVLSRFPNTPESPDISLRLGRIQRDLGAFKSALNKFYNVLHATLRVKNSGDYQALVQRAQFEIAETHFALGEYPAAGKFYARLKLLDLGPDMRSEVHFKSAYLLFLSKDYPGALTTSREYLKEFAGSVSAPEAQYVVIRSLKALGRDEEALQETVKLLRAGREHGKDHPQVWEYWQQKTGSELASELYGKADFLNALTIYQRLAEISDQPETRWPAVYQIGLCFERLRYFDRALEAFHFIAKAAEGSKGTAEKPAAASEPLSINLETLREMAQWRLDHLKWLASTDRELAELLNRKTSSPLEGAGFMVKPGLRPNSGAEKPTLQAAG